MSSLFSTPRVSYHSLDDQASTNSYLEKMPVSLLGKMEQFLTPQESARFINASKKVRQVFEEEMFEKVWQRNPPMRQVYGSFIEGSPQKWRTLKALLRKDLKMAKRIARFKTVSFADLPPPPATEKTEMLKKYFFEFRQIAHIVRQPRFFSENQPLERAYPMRGGSFCSRQDCSAAICGCYSCSWPSLIGLACSPSPTVSWIIVGGCLALPWITFGPVACCIECETRPFLLQAIERFKAIKELSSDENLIQLIQTLPAVLAKAQSNQKKRDFLIELLDAAELLKEGNSNLPNMQFFLQQVQRLLHRKTPLTPMEIVWFCNKARLIATKTLIRSRIPENDKSWWDSFKIACLEGDVQQVKQLMIRHIMNVNEYKCRDLLLKIYSENHEPIFGGEQEEKETIAQCFVEAGLDLWSFGNSLTLSSFQVLLDAGIFANDPELLDSLCFDRYDLAFLLFLYGFESKQIKSQLKQDAFVPYQRLQAVRKQHDLRLDKPRARPLLCRTLLIALFPPNPRSSQHSERITFQSIWNALEEATERLEERLAEEAARRAREREQRERRPFLGPH